MTITASGGRGVAELQIKYPNIDSLTPLSSVSLDIR